MILCFSASETKRPVLGPCSDANLEFLGEEEEEEGEEDEGS